MVKSVLSVYHLGLRDWFIQRVSAILMVLYTLFLMVFFISTPNINYMDWNALFAHLGMKIATLLVFASLLYHAWVGMWTIFTDYIKIFVLRLVLQLIVIFALLAFFFEALFILWGV